MNNLDKIGNAINFIENNLKEDIHLDKIASEACCSKYHFHRLFQQATGETTFNYIRKRRLSESAKDILNTNLKIWEIANEYQFGSIEAFSRSFVKAFGKTPTEYRKKQKRQIYFGRVRLSTIRLKHYSSNINLEPEIRELDNLYLAGRKLAINKDNIDELIAAWYEIKANQNKLNSYEMPEVFEIHQFVSNPDHFIYHDENSTFHRIISARKDILKTVPDDFVSIFVPKGKYAVFTHNGTRIDSHLTVDYIWATWMMKNDIETDERPAFEYYGSQYLGPYNPNSKIEYYLPVS